MDLSITPHFTRDDALLHARKFFGGMCPQNLTLMYLGKFSHSFLIDCHFKIAEEISCQKEGTFLIDCTTIKSFTAFNGLSSNNMQVSNLVYTQTTENHISTDCS